jgi:hypothetical protein
VALLNFPDRCVLPLSLAAGIRTVASDVLVHDPVYVLRTELHEARLVDEVAALGLAGR